MEQHNGVGDFQSDYGGDSGGALTIILSVLLPLPEPPVKNVPWRREWVIGDSDWFGGEG